MVLAFVAAYFMKRGKRVVPTRYLRKSNPVILMTGLGLNIHSNAS